MALRQSIGIGNGVRRRLLEASQEPLRLNFRSLEYRSGRSNRFIGSLSSFNTCRTLSTERASHNNCHRHIISASSENNGSRYNMSSFNVAKITADGAVALKCSHASELLRKSGSAVNARDLYYLALTRRQDGSLGHLRRPLSAILPRGNEILLSFGCIRGVIGTESAVLFDAHSAIVKQFAHEVAETFRDQQTTTPHDEQPPFELVFIEEVLRGTCDAYNRRIHLYEPIVDSMLNRVSNEVFSDSGVHQLVPVKDSLQEFEMQVKQGLGCLTNLLENDEDMLGLLLTEQETAKTKGEIVGHERHEGVELMLEHYSRQLSNVLFEIQFLLQRIQSKQEFVSLALDGYRNRLIRMNAYLGMTGLGIGVGTAVAGFFGMNVISGYEESTTAFSNIIMSSSITGVLLFVGCSSYISGSTMKQRAIERLDQIDTLSGALSDMGALDYTVKEMMERGTPMTKHDFRKNLVTARQSGRVTSKEVDLLFHALDVSGDGLLYCEDFRDFEKLARRRGNKSESRDDTFFT